MNLRISIYVGIVLIILGISITAAPGFWSEFQQGLRDGQDRGVEIDRGEDLSN